MGGTQTYTGITMGVAEDFYTKALASGFTVGGPAPTSFAGTIHFALVYKHAVEFGITYDSTSQVVLLDIAKKNFPYNLVPDAVIFSQVQTFITQAKAGTLQPHMSIWSNSRHANEVRWGGFAKPYFHLRKKYAADGQFHFSLSETSYTVPQIAKMYEFPPGDGLGETIGLVELGGGYLAQVLDNYLPGLSLRTEALSVDGAANNPGQEADGEVYLDIEIVGALLPKAKIIVAFAPNTDQGFADAIIALTPRCTRISISWGAREDNWTPMGMAAVNTAIADAQAKGVDVTVAQGDNAYTDGGDGPGVDFPGSSPFALSCGGTALHHSISGGIVETVWDSPDGSGTGGGISSVYELPPYQQYLTVKTKDGQTHEPAKRITPDVSGVADPATGYVVLMADGPGVVGGTSAVAPLWAALLALIGKKKVTVHTGVYSLKTPELAGLCFNQNITGDNGEYVATPGHFSAAVGLGTPRGAGLVKLFRG